MCALYGLKQTPRACYSRIENYFIELGFTKSEADVNLYHILVEGELLIIVLYVDDLILTGDEKLTTTGWLMNIKPCDQFTDGYPWSIKEMVIEAFFIACPHSCP